MASSSSVVTTGYGVKLAKEAWPGVPDISPAVIYSFQVQAMSADGLTCVFPVAFTIDPRADRHAKVISAAVDELVKGVLEETRALARSMTKEQIFHGDSAEWFKKKLFKSVQMKLDQFGLTINANMKQPGDGYLSYLGQEPEALAQAKVGVAETPANGEVGAMEREGMALHNTAEGSKEEAEVQVFKIKRDEEAGEASVGELAMKKARLERLPRVAEVELVKAERQTEKLIMAENLAVGGQQANWELYNNQQKATEARLFELEKQAGARPRKRDKAAMGEAQSAYFNLNLGDKNKNTHRHRHRHRHRALVDRRSDEEAVGEEASQNLKSATVGGKLLEAAIESTAEVSEVHDNSDDRDLEAGLGSIAQMVTPGASKEQLARALLMVSHASLFFGVSAGVRQPATTGSIVARHQAAYYGLVAAILAAVPVEMATAFYLRRSNNRRFHAFAQGLRGVGVVLLITVAAVGGFVLTKA